MRLPLVSLTALCLALNGAPAFGQAHDHGHAHDDHGHAHDDHGHGHDDHGDAHEDHHPSGLRLELEADAEAQPGVPLTLGLNLSGPDGETLLANDLVEMHGHKLHVVVVDEGLEDFQAFHPEAGPDGGFEVRFTPQFPRIYRVWVKAEPVEPFDMSAAATPHDDHEHGHDDHAHDDAHAHDDHGDHDDHGSGHTGHHDTVAMATDWVRVGDEAAPYILPQDELTARVGDLSFTLSPQDHAHAGETLGMTLSVTDSAGTNVTDLQSFSDAVAHVTGFSSGAASLVHAHGDQADGAVSFDITFEETGLHRLFIRVKRADAIITAPFTLVVDH